MGETRKLAAILVADVVGYSRLAGADEDRTLARLRGLRSDLIDPAIAAHHGRIVKRTGDGSIVEFRSVVDAVRCAVEVQQGLIERNSGVQPDRQIEFRVGIHLGDVVEESDGDLMGDGVNIAARLEGIAAPGAICLSEDAYRQVKGRLDLAVTDLGATRLKNIVEPIRVYSLQVRVRAVKFTDIVGSTEMTARLGDSAALELVRAHDALVRRGLEGYGGREIKHTGDGIMASFDKVQNSVRAAADIQRRFAVYNADASETLSVRIGIDAGEPVEDHNDLFGSTVQLASRLCSEAEANGIIVSGFARELCQEDATRFVALGERRFKGFADKAQVFRFEWRD